MSPDDTNRFLDEYEQDVDEIIAACRGDLRGAVRALMLINEQLEQTLRGLSAILIERAGEDQPPHLLHRSPEARKSKRVSEFSCNRSPATKSRADRSRLS